MLRPPEAFRESMEDARFARRLAGPKGLRGHFRTAYVLARVRTCTLLDMMHAARSEEQAWGVGTPPIQERK